MALELPLSTHGVSFHLPNIPYDRITHAALKAVGFVLVSWFLVLLICIHSFLIFKFLQLIRAGFIGRLPRTFRGIMQAARELPPYLTFIAIALFFDIGFWYDSRHPPHSGPYHPPTDPDFLLRVLGAILILVTGSFALVVMKQLFLRWYAIFEFTCGVALAAYSVRNLPASGDVFQLVPAISAVYFLVRAIENFKKDLDQRKDKTYDKLIYERRSRYTQLKWQATRFVEWEIVRPLKSKMGTAWRPRS